MLLRDVCAWCSSEMFVQGAWCFSCAASVTLVGQTGKSHMCKDHDRLCSLEDEGRKGNVPLWTELGRKGSNWLGEGWKCCTLEPLQYINHGKCVCLSHRVGVRKP